MIILMEHFSNAEKIAWNPDWIAYQNDDYLKIQPHFIWFPSNIFFSLFSSQCDFECKTLCMYTQSQSN